MPDWVALTSSPHVSTFTEGVGRGFLLYFLPLTVLRRGEVKKNIMRRALAVGIFCGVVRIVRYKTQYQEAKQQLALEYSRNPRNATILRIWNFLRYLGYKYPCHISGAIGTVAATTFDPSLMDSQLLALWLLVRAVRAIMPTIPYGSEIAMSASAAQILSCFGRAPQFLDPSYLKFLNIHGGLSRETLQMIRTNEQIVGKQFCELIHPNQSCTGFGVTFFGEGFIRAVKVYAPLYVVFFLFSRSKNIQFLVMNLIRSSAFLALYCTSAWLSGCVFHRITNVPLSKRTLASHAWVSGMATLLERQNRRAELAAYCVTYALDSLLKQLTASKAVPKMPYLVPFIFCVSLAVLVDRRKSQPWIFSHFMLGDEHPLHRKPKPAAQEQKA